MAVDVAMADGRGHDWRWAMAVDICEKGRWAMAVDMIGDGRGHDWAMGDGRSS